MKRFVGLSVTTVLIAGMAAATAGAATGGTPVTTPSVIDGQLSSVSCWSASGCMAVGSSSAGGLAELWNGTTWSVVPIAAGSAALSGVSCPSGKNCIAVGGLQAERWNGKTWSLMPALLAGNGITSAIVAVSCTSAVSCTAVGTSDGGGTTALAEQWNGTTWSLLPLGSLGEPGMDSSLSGVSCRSTSCTAIGDSGVGGDFVPQSLHWTGANLSAAGGPPAVSDETFLRGVSCTSATACAAVGTYYNQSISADVTLAVAWKAKSSSLQLTPFPTGSTSSSLNSVNCQSTTECTAVGSSEDAAGDASTLGETWNGTIWSITPTANPSGAVSAQLSSVSCTASGCMAVGSATESSGNTTTLAEDNGVIQPTP